MSDATPLFVAQDSVPETEVDTDGFVGEFPDSTPDAPYGYFPDGRPRKRRPKGSGGGSGSPRSTAGRMPAEKQAETAAALLARLNDLIGIGLSAAGMPKAAAELSSNNRQFELMARQSLEADPALCKKILSTGASTGKAGLGMAYLMLGASTYRTMREEYAENHPKELENEE